MGGVLLMSVPAFIISAPVSHTMLQKEWEAAAQEEWENNPPVTTSMLTASKPEDPHPADFAARKADDERLRRSDRSYCLWRTMQISVFCFITLVGYLCFNPQLWYWIGPLNYLIFFLSVSFVGCPLYLFSYAALYKKGGDGQWYAAGNEDGGGPAGDDGRCW